MSSPTHAQTRARLRNAMLLVVAMIGIFALPACGGDDDDAGPVEKLPPWIQSVQPLPGSSATANTVIEIRHEMTDPDHFLRLIVDGDDVTDEANVTQGLITFEPMGIGSHTATVERVLEPVGDEPRTVIDSFTWSFDTL